MRGLSDPDLPIGCRVALMGGRGLTGCLVSAVLCAALSTPAFALEEGPSLQGLAGERGRSTVTADLAASTFVRSCGSIREVVPKHLRISNISARGLECRAARLAAERLYHCLAGRQCAAVSLRFRCTNLGRGEGVDERCVAGLVVVRFQYGV